MTSEAVARPATARQLAYLESLRGDLGITQPDIKADELTSKRAALMISDLISQSQKKKKAAGQVRPSETKTSGPINQARFGLACKEIFRSFDRKGWSPFGPRANQYAEAVIDLYALFAEVEKMMQGRHPKQG